MFAGVLLPKAAAPIFPNHGRNLGVKKWKTKKKQLEASGRFAEIGAMQIKEAAPSPKPSGRFAHLSGIEVKPATDESDMCPK